jgi:hypothetical protein
MTTPKIERLLNDPDAVTHIASAIRGLSYEELIIIKRRLTSERTDWAHEQRQVDPSARRSFSAWRSK